MRRRLRARDGDRHVPGSKIFRRRPLEPRRFAPGKVAEMVLINGDPAKNICDVRDITAAISESLMTPWRARKPSASPLDKRDHSRSSPLSTGIPLLTGLTFHVLVSTTRFYFLLSASARPVDPRACFLENSRRLSINVVFRH